MVFHDISPLGANSKQKSSDLKIASPGDRLLALFLDFLILGPIVGIFTVVYLREIKSFVAYRTDDFEVLATLFLMAVVAILSSSIMQTLFIYFFGATPGQRFLYLRVRNFENINSSPRGSSPSLSQVLLRSLSWWISIPLFFIPMLEILSHPFRRAFHDRLADTLVVCLKKKDSRPLPSEGYLVSHWMQMFGIIIFGFFVISLFQLEDKILSRHWSFSRGLDEGLFCDSIDSEISDPSKRLDRAMVVYLSGVQSPSPGESSRTCLEREADFALWQRQQRHYPLAYVAKAISTEWVKDRSRYEKYFCLDPKSEECLLGRLYLANSGPESEETAEQLRKSGLRLEASQLLLMQDSITKKNYLSGLALVENMMKDPNLEPLVYKTYIRLIWAIQNSALSLRTPASDEGQFQSSLDLFKERYGIE